MNQERLAYRQDARRRQPSFGGQDQGTLRSCRLGWGVSERSQGGSSDYSDNSDMTLKFLPIDPQQNLFQGMIELNTFVSAQGTECLNEDDEHPYSGCLHAGGNWLD